MSKCQFPDGISVYLGGNKVDPCKFELYEIYENVTVEILRCPVCGEISIGWKRQDNTEDIMVDGCMIKEEMNEP